MKTTRKAHYLCPQCQKVLHGTVSLEMDEPAPRPMTASAVWCPNCNIPMIDVDTLSIPVLQELHKRGYDTFASCDRYHEGFDDPNHSYEKGAYEISDWYEGGFVGIRPIDDDELEQLKAAEKIFNEKYAEEYCVDIWDCEDDNCEIIYDIGINCKMPGDEYAIECNNKLLEFIKLWLQLMEDAGIVREAPLDLDDFPYCTLRCMPELS